MKKLPEYITSTPRLIAVILTLVMCYLSITGVVDPKDFVVTVSLVFGYFFGSRWKDLRGKESDKSWETLMN